MYVTQQYLCVLFWWDKVESVTTEGEREKNSHK